PGKGWSHQRWDEFPPAVWFRSALAGSRVNGGVRDALQDHGYSVGGFAPGGLYHFTAGGGTVPALAGSTAGIDIRFHPAMPEQQHDALWTFDGTLPPKLLQARLGETVLFRHYNALPIDVATNRGFGVHTISTHEHNGHSPAESDGYANAFYFPGQFWDYRWPLQLAGHDSINTDASDVRAGRPDGAGGITRLRGDWRETMSTHWFHDHMLDFTAQNVYKGNAAMMNYYSAVDRGNEGLDDGVNLRFPSGTALDWGNRDYDINLVIADKAWDRDGQLWFNPFNLNGFLGDQMLT
ncbi:MAG: copper oxidase, partial [bacterium]|nr:copper oxidase [bacterium]